MKENTEKHPIDNLFARKLSNTSLTPSPDGYERLRKRMNQDQPESRIVFWRDPAVQPYMAAASVLIVCLFGWLYWQYDAPTVSEKSPSLARHTQPERPQESVKGQPGQTTPSGLNRQPTSEQVATTENTSEETRLKVHPANKHKSDPQTLVASTADKPVLAQAEKNQVDLESIQLPTSPQADYSAAQPMAVNTVPVNPNPTAERVLIVTIEEPTALIAARQTAQKLAEEKTNLANDDQANKDTKGGVWQQVRRFKEGELLARHNDNNTDERGLLDRAYNSLKHSFDKNKPAKQ